MTPLSFCVLFIFIYSLRIKKLYCHFIFFGPFCTYSFSHVLALPQVLPFFYFYNSCGHVHSFIILLLLTRLDSLWLIFLLYFYSADCAFSSFTFHSFLHRRVLSFSFLYFSCLRHVPPFLLFILLLVYPVAYVYFVWLDCRLVIYKEDEGEPWKARLYIGYGYLAEEVTLAFTSTLLSYFSLCLTSNLW